MQRKRRICAEILYVLRDGELTTALPCAKELPEKPDTSSGSRLDCIPTLTMTAR